MRGIVFGENKVCGLTRNVDARSADEAGAVYGGAIFVEGSPRCISVSSVEGIFEGTSLVRVGVFQNHSIQSIEDSIEFAQLEIVQLHGDESIEFMCELQASIDAKQFGNVRIWRALPVSEAANFDAWFLAGVDRIVVDHQAISQKGGLQKGGTGKVFNWSSLPDSNRDKLIVAGGIGPDNVADAIRLGCCGVDMNSMLEDEPGIKSSQKIRTAFELIRNYGKPKHG